MVRSGRGTWRRLEHTADLRVEFRAPDIDALFRVGADCLFELMLERTGGPAGPRSGGHPVMETVRLNAPDTAELFLDWLRELLFLFSARGFVLAGIARLRVEPEQNRLEAELVGEKYDPARHRLKLEIKSPTYHQYRFESDGPGWRAELLFDI